MAYSFIEYTADGIGDTYAIPFGYLEEAEIAVFIDGVSDATYTFVTSGTVQATSVPANGATVRIVRTTDLENRVVDFASGSILTEEDLDTSNIQVFHAAQEAIDIANSSIKLDESGLFAAGSRRIINIADPIDDQDAATKIWVETSTAASVAAAALSESNAATSESNAATSESNAATSESNASTSVANAATEVTYAAEWANKAEDLLISVAAGGDNLDDFSALHWAAKAAASYDSFDDRYLGAKALDPTVDNDGDALVTGALYFDTTLGNMKVYNGATWDLAVEIVTKADGSVKTPKGGNAGRDPVPEAGFFRFNTDTVNFEGYDGTVWTEIIDGTDLGVKAAGIATTNTFTISQIGTVTIDNDLSFDMAVTNNFKCTVAGTGTLTFTNITSGQSGNIWLDNTGAHAISAAATTFISASDLTTLSTAGIYFLSYYADGTNVLVSVSKALTGAGA